MTPDEELALSIAEALQAAGMLPQDDIIGLKEALTNGTLTRADWERRLAPIFPVPALATGNGN